MQKYTSILNKNYLPQKKKKKYIIPGLLSYIKWLMPCI